MSSNRHGISHEDPHWSGLLESVRKGRPVRMHSGRVQPGDVFVALPGSRADGRRFIPDAVEHGAAVVVSGPEASLPEGSTAELHTVRDPQQALGELARAASGTERLKALLIGITGTNGKTTVAAMLEALLQRAGWRVGVLGTVSYRWPGHEEPAGLTTPDCLTLHSLLARMDREGVQVVCMEVSSHALDQGRIAGLDFDVALFTNLSQDHLDYHEDMEAYFRAKARLFSGRAGRRPRPVLNLDDPFGARLARELPDRLGYTLDAGGADSTVWAEVLSASRQGLHLSMRYGDRTWEVTSPLIGRHNASNLAAAQAAGLATGLPVTALESLSGFVGVSGRLERVPNELGLHIFIDYAHSPDALEKVLSSVRALDFGRLVVVFGCGGDRDRIKRPLMGRVVARLADVAVLTSDNPRNEDPRAIMQDVLPGLEGDVRLIQEPDRRAAIARALEEITPEDALIIAGKGHEDYQEIAGRRHPFSDLQAVRELLQACR